jgi:hypothetical protein
MIVYVATWPRCGNSVLRDLFWLNWRVTVTDPYMPASGLATWRRIMTGKHGIEIDPDEPQIFTLGPHVGLVPGWLEWLTEERRRELAADSVTYYLKTHEPPYDDYFPGERVVQMVRHPLPACWSWHCLSREDKELAPEFLAKRGNGTTLPGYVTFHERWLAARVPTVRIAYEHHFLRPEATVRTIAAYLDLPLDEPRVTSFTTMKTMNPVRYRAGRVAGWQGSQEQADAVWAACAPVAARLGYHTVAPEPPRVRVRQAEAASS